MTATTLDGKLYRAELFEDLKKRVAALDKQPGLATVLVGEDPGSHSYVKMKHRDCEELGIASIRKDLPEDTTQEELEAVIAELNADDNVTVERSSHLEGQRNGWRWVGPRQGQREEDRRMGDGSPGEG